MSDLIIVNGGMPGMDGPEAVAEIRRRELEMGLPRIPIAIESRAAAYLDAGMAAGADAKLGSPFDLLSGVMVETVRVVAAPGRPRPSRP